MKGMMIMIKCLVKMKYKDSSLDNKLFVKGDIVEYSEEKALKLKKSGYVDIIENNDIANEGDLLENNNENIESHDTDDQHDESENDDENKGTQEIEMASMPKKFKKKM